MVADNQLDQQFLREQRLQCHRRYGGVLWVALCLFLWFSILDSFLAPGQWAEFLAYRLGICALYLVLLLLRHRDREAKLAYISPMIAYAASLLVLDALILRMGGVRSPYFAGFIVAIVFYTATLPLSWRHVLGLGALSVLFYMISVSFPGPRDRSFFLALFNNSFFMASFVGLLAINAYVEERTRRELLRLRLAEEEMTARLDNRAMELEKEVAFRSREFNQVEDRYKNLFEQVADNIILLGEDGKILRANPPFFRLLGINDQAPPVFFTLIPLEEQAKFRKYLVEPLLRGETVRGFQTGLLRADNELIETEITGKMLYRHGQRQGLQLAIRDISRRRKMEEKLRQSLEAEKQAETATIMALARLSEYRDRTPPCHLERIREYVAILAEELGRRPEGSRLLDGLDVRDLSLAAVLHDIGKVGVNDAVLKKREELTESEQEDLRQHTVLGGDILRTIQRKGGSDSRFLKAARDIAYFHHERWDGHGYPFGMRGDDIPIAARIVALADGYEAMTASSLYSEVKSHFQAIHDIIQQTGRRYDPLIVDCFLACEEDFAQVIHRYPAMEEGTAPSSSSPISPANHLT